MLLLPSDRLLQLYKNLIKQEPGVNSEVFALMKQEADKRGLDLNATRGGMMLNEMAIQVKMLNLGSYHFFRTWSSSKGYFAVVQFSFSCFYM